MNTVAAISLPRLYPPLSLRDISPSRGEIGPLNPRPSNMIFGARQMPMADRPEWCAQPIFPLEGEMSGRTEGGNPRHGMKEMQK